MWRCRTQHQRHLRGFTMIELLVASVVASLVLSAALGLVGQQRRQLLGDRARAEANGSMRLALDLVGTDIKQAGERLDGNLQLPAISVINGASNAPDRLVLQRKLIAEVLPVCQTVSGSQSSIDVAVVPNPGDTGIANCGFSNGQSPKNAAESPELSDTVRAFREFRCEQDENAAGLSGCTRPTATTSSCAQTGGTDRECAWAYIYDPVSQQGEFFLYSAETSGSCTSITGRTCLKLNRANSGSWQRTYTYSQSMAAADQPRIYVLEERDYRLTLDTTTSRTDDYALELRVNRQTPLRMLNQLADFQIRAKTGPTTWLDTFNPNLTYQTNWQTIRALEVKVKSVNPNAAVAKLSDSNLTLSSQFYPRNAASQSK